MAIAASKRVRPSAAVRAGRFSVWFGRISRALSQQMLAYSRRELGLNLAEYRALSMLAECRSASIKDIAAGTELDKAQITRAVADLRQRGLVIHTVDGRDRRLRVVRLTPAGRTLVAKSVPFAIERQARMENVLSQAELQTLWKALGTLLEEVQTMAIEEEQTPRQGREQRKVGRH